MALIVHIINHTHWDREWFLTSAYTSRWIPGLIDKLEKRASENPEFRYLFDGQTLIIEDLLRVAPDYTKRVRKLIKKGVLTIGPYYSQPDWQLTSGELLIRNLIYGEMDMRKHGGNVDTGWLVDTFGHISQGPQIHRLFGIKAVYVWRGVPELKPYFNWHGSDGNQLLTINLFGGYRNLYGVSHTPEVAARRLDAEIEKLHTFYPTPDIPLFDGYDLEDNPEDPLRFFDQVGGIRSDILLRESSPAEFAQIIVDKNLQLPTIQGELNSGKYGATFPGVFSARTYLKIMAHDCEHLLFQVCEPLGTMARLHGRPYNASQYETWGRLLLQNAVHDCICGVSIDQVHEKMEYSYRQAFDGMVKDAQASLETILSNFATGDYAVSTTSFPIDTWQAAENEFVHIQTHGVGVWPLGESLPITLISDPTSSFNWQNSYYQAAVGKNGIVQIGEKAFGQLVVLAEHGDTYSEEKGEQLGVIQPTSTPVICQKSTLHCVLRFHGEWRGKDPDTYAKAIIHMHFDQSPLVKWQIDLDSRGTDLRIEIEFASALENNTPSDIIAGMPFDAVQRPLKDSNLLPRHLPDTLERVLLGQRELNSITAFPMQNFLTVLNNEDSVSILSKGIRTYSVDEAGVIRLPLRRAVEWLTKAQLKDRVGDAGPFFYVPDARCERVVRHEIAVAVGVNLGDTKAFQGWLAAYQNPPLIVRHKGSGTQTHWKLLQESLPMSCLQIVNGDAIVRFHNPTEEQQALSHSYIKTTVTGDEEGQTSNISPKQILTVQLPVTLPEEKEIAHQVQLKTPWVWRVGNNSGLPDPYIIQQLESKIEDLASRLAEIDGQLASSRGTDQLRLKHQYYVLKREQVEFQLSSALNKKKLAEQGTLRYEYLYLLDDEISAIGYELNQLRIKRRIFDYVIQVL